MSNILERSRKLIAETDLHLDRASNHAKVYSHVITTTMVTSPLAYCYKPEDEEVIAKEAAKVQTCTSYWSADNCECILRTDDGMASVDRKTFERVVEMEPTLQDKDVVANLIAKQKEFPFRKLDPETKEYSSTPNRVLMYVRGDPKKEPGVVFLVDIIHTSSALIYYHVDEEFEGLSVVYCNERDTAN